MNIDECPADGHHVWHHRAADEWWCPKCGETFTTDDLRAKITLFQAEGLCWHCRGTGRHESCYARSDLVPMIWSSTGCRECDGSGKVKDA